MAQTDHTSSPMSLYAGWVTVDGQCYPFGAETNRRCLQMIAKFICSIAEMHGVYINSNIRRLASDEVIDPDTLDGMMQNVVDDYLGNRATKITAFVLPLLVPVFGQTIEDTLFIAMLDKSDDFAGYVTTDQVTAENWLTDYVAQVFGPSVGTPGMSVDEAKNALEGEGVINICPLSLSPNLEMVMSLAALTP
ncbi:hypothetical protein NKW53_07705 [Acetobacter orientalis]|uniref:hypothetical protein n=1 Tax=Acetobacter orientalis TaxID=146474 RepID=UPI00209F2B90|nr:hypothetical protein [Acetobacter orientalis]MCP1215944.1 hypothetical protein [Acetobacter orientalis]MCP1217896.1 hypothetical protein [Acetobacter orientalis]